jgi:four helix bundle protein
MKNYKNLTVWQDSHELVLSVYKETKTFPKEEVYGITSQLRRATASIPANIAEGSAKNSDKDFGRYLQIAMGSLNESEYFLFLSKELNYLEVENHNEIVKKLEVVKAKLINLQKKLN